MKNKPDSTALYMQLAMVLENKILSGEYKSGGEIPSSIDLAKEYSINVATAQRGIHVLIDKNILAQKRGICTCVCESAFEKLFEEHASQFYEKYVLPMVMEAKTLGFTAGDIAAFIESGFAE